MEGQGIAIAKEGDIARIQLSPYMISSKEHKSAFKPLFLNKPLVIWSNDFYVSPIYDLKNLIGPLGVEFIDKSLSDTCGRTGTCATDLKVLNRHNAMSLTQATIDHFYAAYKDDPQMEQVDAFVCFYPVSLCRLFVPFNKTIIFIASHRYELGVQDSWNSFNILLKELSKDPKHVIAANNLYDAEYIKYFTGLNPIVIPNYCGYISVKYTPERDGFLLAAGRDRRVWNAFMNQYNTVCDAMNCTTDLFPLRRQYPSYSYRDIAAHQGIVYVPHQVTTMSLFEQYRMNIPLFFPSIELLSNWQLKYMVMPERTLAGVEGHRSAYSAIQPDPTQKSKPNPNNDRELHAIKYWLKFSDFYQFPYIIYYDSFEDLIVKLETTNLHHISLRMEWHNEVFQEELMAKWRQILASIADHSSNHPN